MARSPRIVGVDVVRGLAVIGMFGGHVGDWGVRDANGDGWEWLFVVDGRPSATFALLMGLSVSLMLTGRSASEQAAGGAVPTARATRLRVLVRAVLVVAIGYGLGALGTPVAVILMSFGTMLALAIPMLRWTTRWLVAAGVAFAVGGPVVIHYFGEGLRESGADGVPLLNTLWGLEYTGLIWMAYVIAGLVVGRMKLAERATQVRLGMWGLGLMLAGYVGGPLLGGTGPLPRNLITDVWWASAAPHSRAIPAGQAYATPEVVGNIGVTLLTLALLIPLARRLTAAFSPLAAMGAMALTCYAAHIVAIWALDLNSHDPAIDSVAHAPSNVTFVLFVAVGLAAAWAWRRWVGAGPLEKLLTVASTRAARRRVAP